MRLLSVYFTGSLRLSVLALFLALGSEISQSGLVALTWFLGVLVLVLIIYIVLVLFPYLRKYRRSSSREDSMPEITPETPPRRPSSMGDEELFQYMSDVIRKEQLFLNPFLDRQALIDRFGVSSHRIGAAFSKGSDFGSLPGYIRILRLEHACKLLLSCPDVSVKAVGEASGFSNNSTFCSDFKNRYGMTPSDYRQEKLSRNS